MALWCGIKDNGISRFDGTSWINYTAAEGAAESTNHILAVGPDGYIWDGTWGEGLYRFDGEKWDKYTTTDGLADNYITCILFTHDGAVWISTDKSGISRFDGTKWRTYTTTDGLAYDSIMTMAEGPDGTIWAVYRWENVLARFDGTNWINYEPDRMLLNLVRDISIENDGTVWCASYELGALRFDGESWTLFTVRDGLASNEVDNVSIGEDNRIYFGTSNGLSILNRDVTLVHDDGSEPQQILHVENYPNPFNPMTTIEFTLPKSGVTTLTIYTVTGQRIRTLANEPMTAGHHTIVWDGTDDNGQFVASGIYFTHLRAVDLIASDTMMLMK